MTISIQRNRISLCLLVLLAPVVVWAFNSLEDRSLYHPDMARFPDNPLAAVEDPVFKATIQDVYFKTTDAVRLNGWYIPAKSGKPTFVFAHGNGGNLGVRWIILQALTRQGYGILAFDYRGYGKSEGKPSETGLYRDMEAASNYLLNEKKIPYQQQMALGESLGSGVVVDVATRIPYQAVILYAAYSSTPDVAVHLRETQQMGWLGILPLNLIMRQHFDSLSKISKIRSPLVIMHGEDDEMMPLSMPRALYAKATASYKKLLIIPHAGHNDVFPVGGERLMAALEDLPARGK